VVEQPERLTCERFLSPRNCAQTYWQRLDEPVAMHWHEFYELFLTISGSGEHVVNGNVSVLVRGVIVLLTPADFHQVTPEPGAQLELFDVVFSGDLLDGEVRSLLLGARVPQQALLEGPRLEETEAEFRRLLMEANERQPGHRRVIQGALERVLIGLAREQAAYDDSLGTRRDSRRKVQEAVAYLHHHFREPLTLAAVATEADLSRQYFSERFHQTTGTPFQTYLRNLRLRFACSLLQVSDLPVTEICFGSGFSDLAHFERVFKQTFGRSPRAYRESAAGAGERVKPVTRLLERRL
jgi:AraC-like DNA-binding protein